MLLTGGCQPKLTGGIALRTHVMQPFCLGQVSNTCCGKVWRVSFSFVQTNYGLTIYDSQVFMVGSNSDLDGLCLLA